MRSPPLGDLRDWVEFAFGPCFHIGAGVGWVVGCVGAGAKRDVSPGGVLGASARWGSGRLCRLLSLYAGSLVGVVIV